MSAPPKRLIPNLSTSPYLRGEPLSKGKTYRGRSPEATAVALPGPGGARTAGRARGRESHRPPLAPRRRRRSPALPPLRRALEGGAVGLGRFYGSRPALPLPFSLLVLAPHLEGRERRLCWTGLLDVSDHGPEPRGRAGRVPGAPAFPAGSERGRGFRYLPPSTGKLTRAALRTGLECSEKGSGRPGPCRAAAGGAGARRGAEPSLPALPSELPT